MPLPRTRAVRVIAAPEDEEWRGRAVAAFDQLDESVSVDAGPPESRFARNPTGVILIWTKHTTGSAIVHREVGEWDRRRVKVHVLAAPQADILGYMHEMATSTHIYSNDVTLRTWLHDTVLEIAPSAISSTTDSIATFEPAVQAYASALHDRLRIIEVVGREDKLELANIYLPLTLGDLAGARQEKLTLLDLFTEGSGRRIFVVGTPGAGKSTLLDYTALKLAAIDQAGESIQLPLLLRATDLVASGYPNVVSFAQLVIKGCVPRVGRQVSAVIVNAEEFGDSNTYLIIDGVDELKRDDRPRLRQLLRSFETEFPDSNIVLAARPSGYEPSLWSEYRAMAVRPLEVVSAQKYVERFASETNRVQLLELLAASERLRELAQVPFMLALMCSYEGHGSSLPLRRAVLIRACVTALLARRPLNPQAGLDYESLHQCLTSVSDRLFRLDSSGGHGESEFLFALQGFLIDRPSRSPALARSMSEVDHSVLILDEILERTGLLQRDGEYIDFVHRSIWEYFVADAFSERPVDAIDGVAGASAWEEPLRLMVGLVDERRACDLLRRMWSKNAPLALRAASECVFDLHNVLQELLSDMPAGETAALVRDLAVLLSDPQARGVNERLVLDTLQVLMPESTSCETLWEGLQVLLRIRDREDEARDLVMRVFRFDQAEKRREQLLKAEHSGTDFLDVSGGSFVMGNDAPGRSLEERPSHPVQVSDFSLSATTTTNAARELFPFPIGFENDQRSATDEHPMIGVTWYEAVVCAIWFACRLPTEAEWEYACRSGGDDDMALFNESRIPEFAWYAGNALNVTHPVGTLRPNSFRVYDMLGNVREWCSDWFSQPYYAECLAVGTVADPTGPSSGRHKVLRGGCFDWNTANLVPTYRNSNLPNNQGFQNGFRLVCGMPDFLVAYLDIARRSDLHPE